MNVFEAHGIKHLSPSSLGTWRENPGLWGLKYLAGFRDEAGPAAWRGNAVEGGAHMLMRGKSLDEAVASSQEAFEATAQGECSDNAEKERAAIAPMLSIIAASLPDKPLIGFQIKVEQWLDNIDVPLIGYIDFIFEDGGILDLKTTHRCPSEPTPGHVRQLASYMKARGVDASELWYVTTKKEALYEVTADMRDNALEVMRKDALSLQRFLERFATPMQAFYALPMNTDHFFWSEAAIEHLHRLEAA